MLDKNLDNPDYGPLEKKTKELLNDFNIEQWNSKINEENYENYDNVYAKNLIIQINQLNNLNVSKRHILSNIDYYIKNFTTLLNINTIIDFIKAKNLSNISLFQLILKYYSYH